MVQAGSADLESFAASLAGFARERNIPCAVSVRVDPVWLRIYLTENYWRTIGLDPRDGRFDDPSVADLLPDRGPAVVEDGAAFDLSAESSRWYRWCERIERDPSTPMECEVQIFPEVRQESTIADGRPDGRAAAAESIRREFRGSGPLRIVLREELPRLQRCAKGLAVTGALGGAQPGTIGGLVRWRGSWSATTAAHVMHPALVGPPVGSGPPISGPPQVTDETTLLPADAGLVAQGTSVRIGRSHEVEPGHRLRLHGLTSGHSVGTVVGRFSSIWLKVTSMAPNGAAIQTRVEYTDCFQLQQIRHTIFGVRARPVSRAGDSGSWLIHAVDGREAWVGTLVGGDPIQSVGTYVESFAPITNGEIDAAMVVPDCAL